MALLIGLVPVQDRALAAVVDDVRSDADWIMSARLPDGAIANYVDKQAIWPYLSNFAAMGLARATEITRNKSYVSAAWSWLAWYRSHMDAQGFVTDYVVHDGKPVSTGFMDSTDAYAGTYLMALRDTYRVAPDLPRLRGFAKSIVSAVGAMEVTQTADGLTWAKPTWRVKYLMDQAEVYAGFRSAAELASRLGDSALKSRAVRGAERVRSGVAALWNDRRASYDWAKHGDDARIPTEWGYLYSDALQQIWAVGFGLVPSVRDAALVSRFVSAQPNWAVPGAVATFSGGVKDTVGYWPVAALALHRVKNAGATSGWLRIRKDAMAMGRPWPYTTATAGQLILAQTATLPGARLLDASIVALSPLPIVSTTSTASPEGVATVATPAAGTPTPSPVAASPSPSPSPYIGIGDTVGPAGFGVSVGPSGIDVTASAAPVATPNGGGP